MPNTGLSPGYLASLSTGSDVLTALQRARKAREALLAGSHPVTQQAISLSVHPARTGHQTTSWCREAAFSADGQYLAVSLAGLSEPAPGPGSALSQKQPGEVVVLRATEGYTEQARIRCHSHAAVFRWAPDASHLSIAEPLSAGCKLKNQGHWRRPAVLVLDARTGSTLHTLGDDNFLEFMKVSMPGGSRSTVLEFSPSGRMLLVIHRLQPQGQVSGSITLFNVYEDTRVAQSRFTMASPATGDAEEREEVLAAAWHPSSKGLVFSQGVVLQDAESIRSAGFAIGFMPEGYCLASPPGMQCSPDGQHVLAHGLEYNSDPYYEPEEDPGYVAGKEIVVLSCRLEGLNLTFSFKQTLEEPPPCAWLPCSSRVVNLEEWPACSFPSKVEDISGQRRPYGLGSYSSGSLQQPLSLSPSGQFIAASSSKGPRVLDLDSGRELWAAHAEGRGAPRAASSLDEDAKCLAFMPSGCGVVCAGMRRAQRDTVAEVHLVSFA